MENYFKRKKRNFLKEVIYIFRMTYYVKIQEKEYRFFLELNKDNKLFFIVPDCGGQADMVPKFPEQLEWTEKHLEKMKTVRQIWPTVWKLNDEDAIQEIEHLFSEKAQLVKKERWDY